jgi:hypothetical protein
MESRTQKKGELMQKMFHGKSAAPRFEVIPQILIQASTLGSMNPWELFVENISASGMFLQVYDCEESPYHANSLLDVVIDPEGTRLPKPIKCVGKVVRILEEAGAGGKVEVRVALTIAQIDDENQAGLDAFLERLAKDGQWEWVESNGQYSLRQIGKT